MISKLSEAWYGFLSLVMTRVRFVVFLVTVISCIIASFCSPYSQSVSQNLLLLTVTAFSILLLVYIFSCNRYNTTLEFLEKALEKGYKNILSWVEQDKDFDAFREDEDFKQLISKYIDN